MGFCILCAHHDNEHPNEDKECMCDLLNDYTGAMKSCPGWRAIEQTAEEKQKAEELLEEGRKKVQNVQMKVSKPVVHQKRVSRTALPITVMYDSTRPVLEPFAHQKEAFDRFKDENEIALFFEMGCGKSFTTLALCQQKFLDGVIKGLLVVAPNDVHKQWYDELVYGVDKDKDGVMWQELSINFEAQCVGGRGGQKELYPFVTDYFKFVSVNVDTFSTPHKWEQIVAWANQENIAICIDEATCIKNPDSKRSKRLLYEFNNVTRRGKTVIKSEKKHPVRIVLTGTPVTNGPMDLWSIMEFVKPNYFGRNYYSFRAYYGMFTKLAVSTGYGERNVDVLLTEKTWQAIHNCNNYQEAYFLFGCSEDTYMIVKHQDKFVGPYKHADELKKLLEPVAVFKKLTDCVDMPPVQYIERKVGMSDAQQAVYNSMKKDLLAQYDEYTATAKNKLVVNIRLQQISSGFIMGQKSKLDEDLLQFIDNDAPLWHEIDEIDVMPNEVVWLGDSNPKLDALMRDVAECDKPLLILTRYSAEAAKIFDMCTAAGYRTGLFTGWKVVGGVDAFKAGELDILVANSTKIHRGFNLQIAHTTLFYSNTFSMEIRQQAEFRTFRLGQQHPCLYIDYTAADVDDTINAALRMKKNLLDYIREKDLSEVV